MMHDAVEETKKNQNWNAKNFYPMMLTNFDIFS